MTPTTKLDRSPSTSRRQTTTTTTFPKTQLTQRFGSPFGFQDGRESRALSPSGHQMVSDTGLDADPRGGPPSLPSRGFGGPGQRGGGPISHSPERRYDYFDHLIPSIWHVRLSNLILQFWCNSSMPY